MKTSRANLKIKKLTIKKPGERQFFQIKLPVDARQIISIEVTATPRQT